MYKLCACIQDYKTRASWSSQETSNTARKWQTKRETDRLETCWGWLLGGLNEQAGGVAPVEKLDQLTAGGPHGRGGGAHGESEQGK